LHHHKTIDKKKESLVLSSLVGQQNKANPPTTEDKCFIAQMFSTYNNKENNRMPNSTHIINRTAPNVKPVKALDNKWHNVVKANKHKNTELPNKGVSVTSDYKKLTYEMIRFQERYAPTKSMRWCNRVPLQLEERPEVTIAKVKGKPAKFCNLMTCNNAWCVSCNKSFREDRRDKAKIGIGKALGNKHEAKMLTLTIPRIFGNEDWEMKFSVVNGVYRQLNDRLRTKLKRRGIKLYTIKGLDVTIDKTRRDPIHLHIHSLLITDLNIDALKDWIFKTYKRLMKKRGVKVHKNGFDITDILNDKEISDYVVKTMGSLEKELSSTNKNGKTKNSKGWWKFLQEIASNPTEKDIFIYRDFLKAAKGKRTYSFSKNWEELLNLPDTDQLEMDFQEEEEEEEFYCWSIDRQLWEAVKSLQAELAVLSIIDDWIDNSTGKEVFDKLIELIEENNWFMFGEEKKNYYLHRLKLLIM